MSPYTSTETSRSSATCRISVLLSLLVLATAPSATRAEEEEARLEAEVRDSTRVTRQERPFGFLVDPSTPSAGVVTMSYGFGLGSGISADRPLPVRLAATNGSHTVALGYGLTSRVSPFASASFAEDAARPGQVGSTVTAGVTWQITRPDSPLRVSLTGAGFHEGIGNANGVTALAAGSLDLNRFRVALNLRADKAFAAGRDGVDLSSMAGVSYRVSSILRVGAEYVGQDLEELTADAAEGGARHAVGPSASVDLFGGRYQLAVASGFGLTPRSPHALVRASLATSF